MGSCRIVADPWQHLEIDDALLDPRAVLDAWPVDGWQDGRLCRKFQRVANASLLDELLSIGAGFRCMLGLEQPELYPVALLVHDACDYRIRPHRDCAGKVLSSQIYLAEGVGHEDRGVTLLGRRSRRQIPYSLNYGYAFAVSKHSWHEVKPCDGERKSIQLIYYDTPTPQL